MPVNALSTYVQQVQREFGSGIAAEHAYRPALKALLESLEDGINAVNDPRRLVAHNAPDFVLLRDRIPVAYVEAKDVDVDLDQTEKTNQMERYRRDFPNLILTDYLEFRWYRGGEHQRTVSLGEAQRRRLHIDEAQFGAVDDLLRDFVSAAFPDVQSPRQLAQIMASMTRRIYELIVTRLPDSDMLKAQKEAFEHTLIPHLTDRDFADMYAQTIAYGLFAARVNYAGKIGTFTRRGVADDIPRTNPFLKRLFSAIMDDLDEGVSWMVDTLIQLLAHTDTDEILKDFGRGTWQNDPVLHFYETFLAAYDPALREKRGVYYTPEPVVSYIVRSVDHLLRTRFNRPDGLADSNTMILDPATGTGTFLYSVVQRIHEGFVGQEGIWNDYVKRHLLPRIFGFELLIAPYTVAHMKMGILLSETGYRFEGAGRLGIYLTNTLEASAPEGQSGFNQFIVQEANEAQAVKREKPIMVVLGNPPYSNFGQLNQGEWITELMREWKPQGEKKWNQDDYMRFMRFAQWRIEKTGQGILAFITNHSYLNGITHRKMRDSLRNTFSEIYILDLHGNSIIREATPNEIEDQNVFDIRPGVSISIFVKEPNKSGPGKVFHHDKWGLRREKYDWLNNSSVANTDWIELREVERESCLGKFFFFTPKNFANLDEYCEAWDIFEVFPLGRNGIKTDRDPLFVDIDREVLRDRVKTFYSETGLSEEFAQKYDVHNSSSYPLLERRLQTSFDEQNIQQCLYRVFDKIWIYYKPGITSRPAWETMRHMVAGENLMLLCCKQQSELGFRHVFCSKSLTDHSVNSTESKEITTGFPLYLYPDPNDNRLLDMEGDWPLGKDGRTPNLSKAFIEGMEARLGLRFVAETLTPLPSVASPSGRGEQDMPAPAGEQETFGPEDVFHYAYAVFHSPTYRERYAEFLKIDFPRLPLTGDLNLFRDLCIKGAALVDLHLLREASVARLITTFPVGGSNEVAGYPRYDPLPSPLSDSGEGVGGRVWINATQYFGGVPEEVWEFHVGGYQVLEKWLKDRRGRTLTYDDIQHYQRVVVALAHTIALMEQIDDLIPTWPLQ